MTSNRKSWSHLFNQIENEIFISLKTTTGDMMEHGVSCAIEHFEDHFLHESVDDEGEGIFAAPVGIVQKKCRPNDVVDAAKSLRSEIEMCFEDGESILKDGKTDELTNFLQVKISELEIHRGKLEKQTHIDQFFSVTKSTPLS